MHTLNSAQSSPEGALIATALIRDQLERRPYVILGVVAGVGLVVGGALSSPMVQGLARFGAKYAIEAAARKLGEIVAVKTDE